VIIRNEIVFLTTLKGHTSKRSECGLLCSGPQNQPGTSCSFALESQKHIFQIVCVIIHGLSCQFDYPNEFIFETNY
jgi:hypothetical protein